MQRINKVEIMTQLVVTLSDQSYLPNIRRIVKSLQGVESVSVPRKKKVIAIHKTPPVATQRRSANFLKGLTVPQGKTSRQLIDEYLEDKYGV